MVSMIVRSNEVRAVRKSLIRYARRSSVPVRVTGDKVSGYYVTIDRGNNAAIVSPRLSSRAAADQWSMEKIGRRPTVRTIADTDAK